MDSIRNLESMLIQNININNFIIFSDTHFMLNHGMSIPDGEYITSWLRLQFKLVSFIFRYAFKNEVKTIIFAGDVFEEKDRIPQPLYNKVWSFFKEYSKHLNLVLNIGNHDSPTLYKTSESSGLLPFSEFAYIVKDVTDIQMGNTFMRIIPYGLATIESITKPKINKNCILVLHEEIAGVGFGHSGYRSKRMDLPLSKLKEWSIVLDGHIHKPQQMYENIYFIGSLLPVDWSEAADKKRFFHYNNGSLKSITIPHQQFFKLEGDLEEAKKLINDEDFFRIKIYPSQVGDDIFKRFNVSYELLKEEKRRIRIKKDLSILDEAKSYIKENNDNLNASLLLNIAKEIVNG